MATVNKKGARYVPKEGNAPYGNASVVRARLETNASGALVDGDQTTALVIGDKVRLALFPAGFKIDDGVAVVSDAFTANVTFNIGFEYEDGVDSATVPQNASYLFSALATTAGRVAANATAALVELPKDAWLIATVAGANNAAVGVLDLLVYGEFKGNM